MMLWNRCVYAFHSAMHFLPTRRWIRSEYDVMRWTSKHHIRCAKDTEITTIAPTNEIQKKSNKSIEKMTQSIINTTDEISKREREKQSTVVFCRILKHQREDIEELLYARETNTRWEETHQKSNHVHARRTDFYVLSSSTRIFSRSQREPSNAYTLNRFYHAILRPNVFWTPTNSNNRTKRTTRTTLTPPARAVAHSFHPRASRLRLDFDSVFLSSVCSLMRAQS